jgi:hypothetical protein
LRQANSSVSRRISARCGDRQRSEENQQDLHNNLLDDHIIQATITNRRPPGNAQGVDPDPVAVTTAVADARPADATPSKYSLASPPIRFPSHAADA